MPSPDPVQSLEASLAQAPPPGGLAGPALALWHAGRGEWGAAHDLVQDLATPAAAWVHAHLHRIEGDLGNAAYWYRRAGRPAASGDLREEWRLIARELLGGG